MWYLHFIKTQTSDLKFTTQPDLHLEVCIVNYCIGVGGETTYDS